MDRRGAPWSNTASRARASAARKLSGAAWNVQLYPETLENASCPKRPTTPNAERKKKELYFMHHPQKPVDPAGSSISESWNGANVFFSSEAQKFYSSPATKSIPSCSPLVVTVAHALDSCVPHRETPLGAWLRVVIHLN